MDGRHAHSQKTGIQQCPAVEGRIFQGLDHAHCLSGIYTSMARQAPSRSGQKPGTRRFDFLHAAVGRKLERERARRCFAQSDVVQDDGACRQAGARPSPLRKRVFQGFCAVVRIKVAKPGPFQRRLGQRDLDAGARREWRPTMQAQGVERNAAVAQRAWNQADSAAHATRYGRANLIHFDFQGLSRPAHAARSDGQLRWLAPQLTGTALRHGPAAPATAIQGHVECAMICRVGAAALPRPGIVGREHAADEGNQSQSMTAIIA